MDEPNNTIPQTPETLSGADSPSAAPSSQPEGVLPSEPTPPAEAAPPPVSAPAADAVPPAAQPVAAKPAAAAAAPAEKKGRRKKEVPAEPEGPQEPKSENLNWYILKVQSNREESIREGLQRRVKIAGLDKFFGDVIVPTEMVTEFKGGKKRVVKRKLYPGYLVVHMEINEETWFLVRETPGIGDFTGASGRPTPMLPHEIARIIARQEEKSEEAPKLKISFNTGDRVKINEGTFENFEGEVDSIDQTNGRVTVMINIFGRSTPVELEYWQIEAV
jgi:transcriptional antiterminator NusG